MFTLLCGFATFTVRFSAWSSMFLGDDLFHWSYYRGFLAFKVCLELTVGFSESFIFWGFQGSWQQSFLYHSFYCYHFIPAFNHHGPSFPTYITAQLPTGESLSYYNAATPPGLSSPYFLLAIRSFQPRCKISSWRAAFWSHSGTNCLSLYSSESRPWKVFHHSTLLKSVVQNGIWGMK